MLVHQDPFLRGQRARLREHLDRNADLANVVQQSGTPKVRTSAGLQPRLSAIPIASTATLSECIVVY
jgi:hypothetical protein